MKGPAQLGLSQCLGMGAAPEDDGTIRAVEFGPVSLLVALEELDDDERGTEGRKVAADGFIVDPHGASVESDLGSFLSLDAFGIEC